MGLHLLKQTDPEFEAAEQAHSDRLRDVIRGEIRAAGSIPFWRFMELALYAPGLGYYSAGKTKFGEAGDFVTAPELGTLFARTCARAVAPVLKASDDNVFLEVGAGTGAFAAAALTELEQIDALPARYQILDRSAELRERQRETLAARVPHLLDRVEWLDVPPEDSWRGVLFANEVLDALPVHRFVIRDGEPHELHVALDEAGNFGFVEREADLMLLGAIRGIEEDLDHRLPEGYVSEVAPQLPYWFDAVCGTLSAGLAVFIDYGYSRREYYRPDRNRGTLLSFYRHRAHEQFLDRPGLQDLTASVDFTALALAATRVRFPLAGFTSQANFLMAAGLLDLFQLEQLQVGEIDRYRLAQEIKRLTLPGEMGERFKVISFARGIDHVPDPFQAYDLSRTL
ncbi:MAG: SAM-dependent methyltransferase [Ahniella sp.]|nr:SAM-dependent methyltransferase [Ahniella sp.]